MAGGANPNLPLPTGFRFFIGGEAGNVQAIDNVWLIPEPGLIGFVAFGTLALLKLRRRK
jgi:hypothetical protein